MSLELISMVVGAILAIFFATYIFIGDTYWYYFAENFYIGGIVALTLFSIYNNLKSSVIDPLLSGTYIVIIPTIIGLMAFSRMTRFRWLARYPVAILSGIGIGISFGLIIRSQVLNLVTVSISDVMNAKPDIYSAIFMLVGVIAVLTYFLYSQKYSTVFHSSTGKLRYFMTFGRYCLMASFGYLAGFIAVIAFKNVADFVVVILKRTIEALMGL